MVISPHGKLPQRIPPPTERTIGSQIGQAALNVVRGCHSPDETAQRSQLSKDRRWDYDRRINEREEIALIRWLRENPQYRLNESQFSQKWEEQGRIHGAEHEVYFQDGYACKRNNLAYHVTWLEYFDRVALHNWLFPETKMELLGFMDVLGDLQPVIRQQIFWGIRGANRTEVAAEMALSGFTPLKNDDYINDQIGLRVEDLHDENVLIQTGGDLIIFDPVVYLIETGPS